MNVTQGRYAKFVVVEGKRINLTVIGEGMTAICYKGDDGWIYKEFFPQQSNGLCYYLRDSQTGELERVQDLTAEENESLDVKYKKFEETAESIKKIYRAQVNANRTPLISWEKKTSDNGRAWFRTAFTSGGTLKEKYAELNKANNPLVQLKKELEYIRYVLDDLKVYHNAGYLHMDVKPENLWCVTVNKLDEAVAVRNLDFGACVKIEDILNEDEALRDLECTPEYYNYKFIAQIQQSEDEDKKEQNLKLLDVKATIKMLAKQVCGGYKERASKDWFVNVIYNRYFSEDKPCFEKYMLAYSLASLFVGNNLDKPFGGLDVETNEKRIQELLSIVEYVADETRFNDACLRCGELKKFNYLLKDKTAQEAFQQDGRWMSPEQRIGAFSARDFFEDFTPRIRFRGVEYRTGEKLSVVALFLQALQQNVKNILLYGEGGMGKSQNLKALKRYLLQEKIPFYSREFKTVTKGTFERFSKEIEKLKSLEDKVIILDGYEELNDEGIKKKVNNILGKKLKGRCKLLIVGSRIASVRETGCDEGKTFFGFEEAYLCPFTKKEIYERIKKDPSEPVDCLSLLRNTMFLRLYLYLSKLGIKEKDRRKLETEASFIETFFEELFREKGVEEVPYSKFYHLGEFIHKERGDSGRFKEEIPVPLKDIFTYEENETAGENAWHKRSLLNAEQVAYINYLHAFYIVAQLHLMVAEHEDWDIEASVTLAQRLFDVACNEVSLGGFFYAGQLLARHPEKRKIFKILNYDEIKENTGYENVLCLFLGAHKGVAKDIEGVFTFYHSTMDKTYGSYRYLCNYIEELRANSIQSVDFLSLGATKLKKIDVNNEVYYSEGNCLIKRNGNELYLGCKSSKIPSGVWNIHKHAFSYCEMKEVEVPDSVTEIDQHAFYHCEKLERVVLGKNLVSLRANAFYKCSTIKTLHIRNEKMRIGKDEYNLRAFIRIPYLERVIIPTTALQYVYIMLEYDKNAHGDEQFKFEGHDDILEMYKERLQEEATAHTKEREGESKDEFAVEDAFIFYEECQDIKRKRKSKKYETVEDNESIEYLALEKMLGLQKYALKRLEIFQGEAYTGPVPLTFEGVKNVSTFKELHLHRDVTEISEDAFKGFKNNLEKITMEKGNKRYCVKDNCLIDTQSDTLLLGCKNSVIPQGVKHIKGYAFAYCKLPKTFVVPKGVESIGTCSFLYCDTLRKIQLPKSLKTVGDDAFGMPDKCLKGRKRPYALKEVALEDATHWAQVFLPYRPSNPIYYAKRVTGKGIQDGKLTLREGISKISSGAFFNAENLTSVNIPSTVTEIGGAAFFGCDIKTVNVRRLDLCGRVELGSFSANPCWRGAKLLVNGKEKTRFVFAPNTTLKKYTFARVNNVEEVVLQEGCVVGEQVFNGCANLREVVISSPKVQINNTAFRGCDVRVRFHGEVEDWLALTKGLDMEGVTSVVYEK